MRSFTLIPIIAALSAVMSASAAPMEQTTVLPVPGIGAVTVGLVLPTNVPNPSDRQPEDHPRENRRVQPTMPVGPSPEANAPANPASRHLRRLESRQVHPADYGVSPNATIQHPPPSPDPAVEKRAAAPHSQNRHMHGSQGNGQLSDGIGLPGLSSQPTQESSAAPHHVDKQTAANEAVGNDSSPVGAPAAGNPFQALSSGLNVVGTAPNTLSSVYYSVPLGVPGTPTTESVSHAPPPQQDKKLPAGNGSPKVNDNINPPTSNPPPTRRASTIEWYEVEDTPAHHRSSGQKRHSLVFDTDPVISPQQGPSEPPRDERMGFLNVDSNKKPQPSPTHKAVAPPQNATTIATSSQM